MWWNVGPHLKRRMEKEAYRNPPSGKLMSKASFFEADSDLEEFKMVLRHKFGSLTRAWRVGLDRDESGLLDFREFCAALRAIGYVGTVRTLWFNMDKDSSGYITLSELDPDAAHELEKFRALCTRKFGSIEACWTQLLDQDHSGKVSFNEFATNVPDLGYTDPAEIEDLFYLLLVRPGATFIQFEDIRFLQEWENTKTEALHRKRLPATWVNKDPSLNPPVSLPGTPSSENWAHEVSYRPDKITEDFKEFLLKRYGTLAAAFDAMDANDNGMLSLNEFQTVITSVLCYCRLSESKRLFLAFNKDPGAAFTREHLNITPSEWVMHLVAKKQRNQAWIARRGETSPTFEASGCGASASSAEGTMHAATSPRQTKAAHEHISRVRHPGHREDIAFWAPLPVGWGKPPDFRPDTKWGGRARGWFTAR